MTNNQVRNHKKQKDKSQPCSSIIVESNIFPSNVLPPSIPTSFSIRDPSLRSGGQTRLGEIAKGRPPKNKIQPCSSFIALHLSFVHPFPMTSVLMTLFTTSFKGHYKETQRKTLKKVLLTLSTPHFKLQVLQVPKVRNPKKTKKQITNEIPRSKKQSRKKSQTPNFQIA